LIHFYKRYFRRMTSSLPWTMAHFKDAAIPEHPHTLLTGDILTG